MRRSFARLLLIAGTLTASGLPALRAEPSIVSEGQSSAQESSAELLDQSQLPTAIELKGARPRVNEAAVTPAATTLPPELAPLTAPPSLALPSKPSEVRIRELRPLSLEQAERLAEVNNPNLKAAVSQVEQQKSALLAAVSAWYPQVNLQATGLPQYFGAEQYRNPDFAPNKIDPETGQPVRDANGQPVKQPYTTSSEWSASFSAQVKWNLIDPARVPQIAAARDNYEKARDGYLIALREVRLRTATLYFALQRQDEQVRIGQQSVRVSLVSLRDARARFEAGVATKLEVLEAETQLARDQRLLSNALGGQDKARRALAAQLDLPQDVTPTAASPTRVLGIWQPSLQESIVAAYAFREELDRFILDISINNSNANAALAAVQPILSLVNTFTTTRTEGQRGVQPQIGVDMSDYSWNAGNTVGVTATWNIFDGGRARALYRQNKQRAQESEFNFASERDRIRQQVEDSFYDLRTANQDLYTTSREVLSARESLRLARLRFQAGVTTQREVVDTQRDLTQAEVQYANAVTSYNTSLAQLRRRTGLDQVQACPAMNLSGVKPEEDKAYTVPIEPTPNHPACQASVVSSQG